MALRISPSCVSKWAKRKRETGSLTPSQIGGYKPRTLSGERADWLRSRIAAGPFTLRGLSAELAERGSRRIRGGVVFVHAEGLTSKNVWPAPFARGFSRLAADPVCFNVSGLEELPPAMMEIRTLQSS